MTVVKREAPEFDKTGAMENRKKAKSAKKQATKPSPVPHFSGCPGSRTMVIEKKKRPSAGPCNSAQSELTQ
jgi:hypothetical protein